MPHAFLSRLTLRPDWRCIKGVDLPHHRAYGSVPRRFDRVKRPAVPPTEEGRSSRRRRWIGPAALSHGGPCARIQTRSQQRWPRGNGTHPDGAVARTEFARSSTVARYTYVIGGGSRSPVLAARSESGRSRNSLASRSGIAPEAPPTGGRPNSRVTKGHLGPSEKCCSVNTEDFRVNTSVRLSQISSHKATVLRPSFAARKPHRIQEMCPNRRTYDFCDTRRWRALRPLQCSKWSLVTRLLGLPRQVGRASRQRSATNPGVAIAGGQKPTNLVPTMRDNYGLPQSSSGTSPADPGNSRPRGAAPGGDPICRGPRASRPLWTERRAERGMPMK